MYNQKPITVKMSAYMGNTLFSVAVAGVFDSWTVLQLAVEHSFGGVESKEKAEWMVYAVEQWFRENKNIEPYELEDFLENVMNAEFDTIVEDGSLPQISSMICGFYRLYSDGKEVELKEKLQRLPKAATSQSSKVHCEEGDSGDEEDCHDSASSVSSNHNATSSSASHSAGSVLNHMDSSCHQEQPSQSHQNQSHSEESMETEEEDGWHVVRRGKRR